jgi:hypothetical protein
MAGCVAGIIKSFQGSEKLINLDDGAAVELTQRADRTSQGSLAGRPTISC